MTLSSGRVTIEYITNGPTPMPIRTISIGDSSSRIWDGSWSGSIQRWDSLPLKTIISATYRWRKWARRWTCRTSRRTRCSPSSEGSNVPLEIDDLIFKSWVDGSQWRSCRHYVPLIFSSIFFLSAVPHYCWGESWNTAYFVGAILRLALQLHGTWFG